MRFSAPLCATALLCATAFALAVAPEVRAQGFGVYEQGTCTMGRAGASVAKPCRDGSALFYNPAGIAGHPGTTLGGGLTLITTTGSFVDDQTRDVTPLNNPSVRVPHLYAAYGLSERLSVGLGVFVPYGLGTRWGPEFAGRYLGYDNELRSIYIQPTIAYEVVEDVRVGAGLDVAYGTVEINQRIDLAGVTIPGEFFALAGLPVPDPAVDFAALGIPPGTDFADANLQGSGTSLGVHLGILIDFNDRASFGARYLSAQTIPYEGEATFEAVETGLVLPANNPAGLPAGTPLDVLVGGQFAQSGLLRTQAISTTIRMPAQVVVGLALRPVDDVTLLVDYQWTGWSVFDRVVLRAEEPALGQVLEENYADTSGLRVGIEADVQPRMTLRAGYVYNQAAAPPETVTPLLPEGERNSITLGVGLRVSPIITIDAAYQRIGQNDRRGRVAEGPNTGLYSFTGSLLGFTATLRLR